jgi:uncharacterized protein
MQLQRFDTIQAFWQQAQLYLLQYEAEHNALLGTVHTLLHYPGRYLDPPYLAIARSNNQVGAIALQTPPNNLQLSKVQDFQALQLIAEDLQAMSLRGVVGLVDEVKAFAEIWQSVTGQMSQLKMEMRLYQLTQVESIATANGQLRLATECDRDLLIQWVDAFEMDIQMPDRADAAQVVGLGLNRQSLYLWEDSASVSVVSSRPLTSTSARINLVYTPPEHRRKGYATASVAALSQRLLDQGCDRCFIFTDLSNPTSNHIYQQVGYHPICDWQEYSFHPEFSDPLSQASRSAKVVNSSKASPNASI